MKKVSVKYISDQPSVFFEKGALYEGYIPSDHSGAKLIAFFFPEEEMDEPGYYALPASRFEIIET